MLTLEPELEPYRATLEASVRSLAVLRPSPMPPGAPADVLRSKLGGTIFWPRGRPYPASGGGRLFPLAQLNLARLPALPWLPAAGLLQAFVDDDGAAQVVYHDPAALGQPVADPAAIRSDFDFFDGEYWIEGELAASAALPGSYDWELLFGQPAAAWFARFGAVAGRIRNAYEQAATVGAAHQLGGYSAVERADHDCRFGEEDAGRQRLLLKIHGDDSVFGALFGAHALYIDADALARRDFSAILLTFESWH